MANRGNEKLEKIHVNHVDIFYEMIGQGRPVVLIHGNGEDHTVFDRTVHLLEKKYTCYLPDSRGHGKNQWTGEFHYRDMAEYLIRKSETDHIASKIPGAEKVILPGESHGSYIVRSEKLAKIILDFLGRK